MVTALLESEAENVEELAKAVIKELDAMRAARDQWVVRISLGGQIFGMGPYPTQHQALLASRQLMPGMEDDWLLGSVVKLVRPTFLKEIEHEHMGTASGHPAGRYCIECRHPLIAHDWPGEKGVYVRRGCMVGYKAKKPDSGCQCGRTIKAKEQT